MTPSCCQYLSCVAWVSFLLWALARFPLRMPLVICEIQSRILALTSMKDCLCEHWLNLLHDMFECLQMLTSVIVQEYLPNKVMKTVATKIQIGTLEIQLTTVVASLTGLAGILITLWVTLLKKRVKEAISLNCKICPWPDQKTGCRCAYWEGQLKASVGYLVAFCNIDWH